MTVYLLRRLYQALIVFFVVTLIVFMVLHISGDPVELLMPPDATPKDMEEMRRTLGLDKPIMVQYGFFLKNAVQGNLGVSYHHGQPALKLVLERLPASLELVATSILISLVLAVPLGILAATRRGKMLDRACLLGSLIGISAPPFWIGIAFILVFAVELQWLPSSGRGTWAHLVLPGRLLDAAAGQILMLVQIDQRGFVRLQDRLFEIGISDLESFACHV